MVILFVVTLISLVVIGLIGEDQIYFSCSVKILGLMLASTALFGFVWFIKRCLKRRSRIYVEQDLDDVEHVCENEIV